jgi:hypothetical protein
MRELGIVGLIALSFAVASYYATGQFGPFGWANLVVGLLALGIAALGGARRARRFGTPAARRLLLPRLALVLAALVAAAGLERAAARSGIQLDLTAEQRYELSAGMLQLLEKLPSELAVTLYYDRFDPRVRSTRLLVQTLERAGRVRLAERLLDEAADEAERYGISSSNTVVLELDGRFETVERPTEGTLFEALHQLLAGNERRTLYVARGEGEGDLTSFEQVGYSGLAAALQTEGYRLRDLVSAAVQEIAPDAAAVLVVGPRRALRDEALGALARYLERGGSLVVMLDPGPETGLEGLLAAWGFELPNALVVDPASGPIEGDAPGVNPLVFTYTPHPITQGMSSTTMSFFLRARPVQPLRKPHPDARLQALAYTSRRAWLSEDVEAADRGFLPERPEDVREDYRPLLAAGRYPRGEGETRIVVFGDSDLASNRHLRAVYNADLVLNAIHWATQREPAITLRPKVLNPDQFPLTPEQSLRMLYGVGLILPELCLIASGIVWLRRRGA